MRIKNALYAIKNIIKVLLGYRIYKKIKKKSGAQRIVIYDYTGLGDVYVFASFFGSLKNKDNTLFTVRGNAAKSIFEMYGIYNVQPLKPRCSMCLAALNRFCGDLLEIDDITPLTRTNWNDLLSQSLAGPRVNMLDFYKLKVCGLSLDAEPEFPNIDDEDMRTEYSDAVIVSPYCNTFNTFDQAFWIELVNRLSKKYKVYTNCAPNQEAIYGSEKLSCALKDVIPIVNSSKYFIGMRSGLCDVIMNTKTPKYILYSDAKVFNGATMKAFCGFAEMGVGVNIKEIEWKYVDYVKLVDKIEEEMENE